MELHDKETLNVSQAVKDVLEGKKPAAEGTHDYPHTMYHPESGEEKTAKNEEEHKALSAKGYTNEKNESPDEPVAKGEKDFKDKHAAKKSGAESDGKVVKEDADEEEVVADPLPEIAPPGTAADTELKEAKFSPALIKKAIAIATSSKYKDYYSGAYRAIEKLKKGLEDDPQVAAALKAANEAVATEASEKQAKYKAFFTKALKKFGVTSPAELKGDDKKKFFDYVDKNYEADNEEDSQEEAKQAIVWKVKPPKGQKNIHPNSKWPGMKPGDIEKMNENYRDLQWLHDDDPEWVKIVKKHKRAFDAAAKGKKLPQKVEDEILIWADLRGSDKDDQRFIDNIISVLKDSVQEEVKEVTITLNTAELLEKKVTIDVDWIGDPKSTKDVEKKFKLKIKVNQRQGTADVTGETKQILTMLTDPDVYGWDKADVLDVFPELK